MSSNIEDLFADLEKVVVELEKFLASSSGEARAQAEQAAADWRNALKDARGRLEKLQASTHKRLREAAHSAAHALRDNPGKSMAIVAAAGFLLGLAIRRQEPPRS